ncbi:MAG: hypothetical protein ACREL1_04310 [bacterium]
MNQTPRIKPQVLVAILAMVLGWVAPVFAEDMDANSQDFIQERSYIGILGAYASIDKSQDFNGDHSFYFYPSPSTIEIDGIPSFAAGYGFGVLLGHREGDYAGELSFIQTYHTASFTGGSSYTGQNTAIYHVVNFDFKRYFLTRLPVQPFVSLGVNYTWIDTNSASGLVDLDSSTLIGEGTSTIDGFGLNLGAGLEIYTGKEFSVIFGAYERFTGYSGITGVERTSQTPSDDATDSFSLNSTGINFVAGCTLNI